jgi:hypothetical protein
MNQRLAPGKCAPQFAHSSPGRRPQRCVPRAMEEELEALASIFDRVVRVAGPREVVVDLPFGESGGCSLSLTAGADYPAAPATASAAGLPRKQTLALAAAVAAVAAAHAGQPHLYDCVQAARAFLGLDAIEEEERELEPGAGGHAGSGRAGYHSAIVSGDASTGVGVVLDRKSLFLAHVAPIACADDVTAVVDELCVDPRIARATHNICAWRYWHAASSTWASDSDDDGEDGAGKRLQLMLQHMEVENALVVVSRWFGGTLLGPVRFQHINVAARTLLLREGYGKRG